MITTLTEDSLRKIEMIIFYRKDIQRFVNSSILKNFKEGYGDAVISYKDNEFQLTYPAQLVMHVEALKVILDDIQEQARTIQNQITVYKPGLFGLSKDEMIVKEYFNDAKKPEIITLIEKANQQIEALLLVLQHNKTMYGNKEFMPLFFDIPTKVIEFTQFQEQVKDVATTLKNIQESATYDQQKFHQAYEMSLVEPFSDFGTPGTTLAKFIKNMNILESKEYLGVEICTLFEQYCQQILVDIPVNLHVDLQEYKSMVGMQPTMS